MTEAEPTAAEGCATVRVLTTRQMLGVLEALVPAFARETGLAVAVDYGATNGLMPRIVAGERGDLVLLTRAALDGLAAEGVVDPQSRAGVARALVGQPSILLADEPTGNLDSKNGEAVMGLLDELHRGGATICMVTHGPRYAEFADRKIFMFDGRVVDEDTMHRLRKEEDARLFRRPDPEAA